MRIFISLGLLLVTPALGGCAADTGSRNLASKLRRLAAQYQSLSTAKIESEQQFYVDSLKNLDHTLNVVDPTATAQPDVTMTAAYGRIRTAAMADSLELAETLVQRGGPVITSGSVAKFVRSGVRDDEEAFLRARRMHAEATKALAFDFAALHAYQSKLNALVKELTELEKPTSEADRLKHLRAIGEAVREQLAEGSGTRLPT